MLNYVVTDVLKNLGLSEKPFNQEEIINLLKNPLCQPWVTVNTYHSYSEDESSVFACFADRDLKESILQGDEWIKHADSFQPGFWIGGGETHYTTGKDDGYDFIVAELYFSPYEQAQIHIFFLCNEAALVYYAQWVSNIKQHAGIVTPCFWAPWNFSRHLAPTSSSQPTLHYRYVRRLLALVNLSLQNTATDTSSSRDHEHRYACHRFLL